MTTTRITVLALSLAILCLLLMLSVSRIRPHSESAAPGETIKAGVPASRESEGSKDSNPPKSETPGKVVLRRADKRWTKLLFLDPASLRVSREAIDYLELTPAQVEETNRALEEFKKDLFEQELSRAFVEVKPDGEEEVVVPGFDRRPIHATLKSKLTNWAAPDLADFILDLISHDSELGVVNSEVRVGFHKGDDGLNRLVFARRVLSPNAYDPDTPINVYSPKSARPDVPSRMSPTMNIRTAALLTEPVKPRVKFLLDAAGSLPKQFK